MNRFLALVISLILSLGCQTANKNTQAPTGEIVKKSSQIEVLTQSGHPDVEISSYTLIAPDPESAKGDAEAVMAVKKKYPTAMRTKDRAIFEEILARDFTFRGTKDFFNREDYIANRISGPIENWSVKYENIALQFIGSDALVTYHNVVNGKDKTGKPEYTERMTWADVYTKENTQWKLKAVHLIDYKEEMP